MALKNKFKTQHTEEEEKGIREFDTHKKYGGSERERSECGGGA